MTGQSEFESRQATSELAHQIAVDLELVHSLGGFATQEANELRVYTDAADGTGPLTYRLRPATSQPASVRLISQQGEVMPIRRIFHYDPATGNVAYRQEGFQVRPRRPAGGLYAVSEMARQLTEVRTILLGRYLEAFISGQATPEQYRSSFYGTPR